MFSFGTVEAKASMPITWVADNKGVLKEIKKPTEQRDQYLLVQ